MKPVKNRVYCQDCGRIKMLFDSEEKANRFIKYNKDEIESENEKSPVRAYNYKMCGCWHVTSKQESKYIRKSIGERLDDNIDIYVVYLSDTGDTRSIQTTLSFSDTIEDGGIKEGCFKCQFRHDWLYYG